MSVHVVCEDIGDGPVSARRQIMCIGSKTRAEILIPEDFKFLNIHVFVLVGAWPVL